MVQEIAQEIIRSARKKGAQDIYFVPKLDAYEPVSYTHLDVYKRQL